MNPISRLMAEIEVKAERRKGSAVAILQSDHRKVETMFDEFKSMPSGRVAKQKLLHDIIKELSVHSKVESELVYPIIDKELHESTQEALQQHHLVEVLLGELQKMSADREETSYKVAVLKDLVENHTKEEESLLLPQLKLSGKDMQKLGEEIKARKQQLMKEFKKPARPKAKRAPSGKASSSRAKATSSRAAASKGTPSKRRSSTKTAKRKAS